MYLAHVQQTYDACTTAASALRFITEKYFTMTDLNIYAFFQSTSNIKKTLPPVAVSKIDKKLEQYTHALEVNPLLSVGFLLFNLSNNQVNPGSTSTNCQMPFWWLFVLFDSRNCSLKVFLLTQTPVQLGPSDNLIQVLWSRQKHLPHDQGSNSVPSSTHSLLSKTLSGLIFSEQ